MKNNQDPNNNVNNSLVCEKVNIKTNATPGDIRVRLDDLHQTVNSISDWMQDLSKKIDPIMIKYNNEPLNKGKEDEKISPLALELTFINNKLKESQKNLSYMLNSIQL